MSRAPSSEQATATLCLYRNFSARKIGPRRAAKTVLMLARADASPGEAPTLTAMIKEMNVVERRQPKSKIHLT